MRIEHVALWTRDLERLAAFYRTYFGASVGVRYTSTTRRFHTRFLTFDSGARLELMQPLHPLELATARLAADTIEPSGRYAHLAIAVGSPDQVDRSTARLREDGHLVLDGPRWTGDGYYESEVVDPDGNTVEITC